MKRFGILWLFVFFISATGKAKAEIKDNDIIESYSKLAYLVYEDAHSDAVSLQNSVKKFLGNPTEENLKQAKEAWLKSRNSYGQTEAFRFSGGPIDDFNEEKETEGPEARINAWPLNEAYIDYVQGNPKAGIIQDKNFEISKDMLKKKNQKDDEADVTTGYHAIEFLLWGQDLNADGPGARPASDYKKNDPVKERRRAYLEAVTELLVDDMKSIVDEWDPEKRNNYAAKIKEDDPKQVLGKIMTGIATLSGFELASERMATSLDSGDQEDEHSCFSDNTHNDFIYNAKGIKNIVYANYGDFSGRSIYDELKLKDKKLAEKLAKQLDKTEGLIANIPFPIDKEVLSTPKNSPSRQSMELAVKSLQNQAELFKEVGRALEVDVKILSE